MKVVLELIFFIAIEFRHLKKVSCASVVELFIHIPAVAATNCITFVVCTDPSGIGSYNIGFVGPGPPSLFILFYLQITRKKRNFSMSR